MLWLSINYTSIKLNSSITNILYINLHGNNICTRTLTYCFLLQYRVWNRYIWQHRLIASIFKTKIVNRIAHHSQFILRYSQYFLITTNSLPEELFYIDDFFFRNQKRGGAPFKNTTNLDRDLPVKLSPAKLHRQMQGWRILFLRPLVHWILLAPWYHHKTTSNNISWKHQYQYQDMYDPELI